MTASDLDDIYAALRELSDVVALANEAANRGRDFDRARRLDETAARGLRAYNRVAELYHKGLRSDAEHRRAYDHYVKNAGQP